MIGILLQDEKVPGVHLAFGDPYGSQTHADWKSTTHVDVLTRGCDVWIDDEQVIAEGQYLLEKFDLAVYEPCESDSPSGRCTPASDPSSTASRGRRAGPSRPGEWRMPFRARTPDSA